MPYTEYRILGIDAHGDIVEDIDAVQSKREALRILDGVELEPGMLYTVEGQRDLDSGVREFRRIGAVRSLDAAHPYRKDYEVVDAKWYRSGSEPDFEIRGQTPTRD